MHKKNILRENQNHQNYSFKDNKYPYFHQNKTTYPFKNNQKKRKNHKIKLYHILRNLSRKKEE